MNDRRLLNIGCGDREFHAPHPWLNIDVRPVTQAEILADVTEGLPFPDGSAWQVYAGHFLEHLPLPKVQVALAEIMRLLAPGGRLMVVGPDVLKPSERKADLGISPGEDRDENPALHSWDCTAAIVVAELEHAGFADVAEIPISSVGLDWPVWDRVTADQFAVGAVKPDPPRPVRPAIGSRGRAPS